MLIDVKINLLSQWLENRLWSRYTQCLSLKFTSRPPTTEMVYWHTSLTWVERIRVVVSDSKQAKNKKKQEMVYRHTSLIWGWKGWVVVSNSKQAKNKQKFTNSSPNTSDLPIICYVYLRSVDQNSTPNKPWTRRYLCRLLNPSFCFTQHTAFLSRALMKNERKFKTQ